MGTDKSLQIISPEIESRVALERIQTLYHDSKFVIGSAFVVTLVMGMMMWSPQTHHMVIGWVAAHFILTLIRGPILQHFFNHKIGEMVYASRWAKLYAAGAFISGCLWGSLPWLMLDPSSIYNVSAIVIVMFGMIAASNVSLSTYPPAFYCFALPALGFLFLRLATEGGDYIYVSVLLLWYLIFNIGQSIHSFRVVSESIRQRFENIELMHDLETKKMEADKANLDKSRFLAATSHDLRQPLHALDLYLGALETNLSSVAQKNLMFKAKKSSQSVGELLNALLDVSRLDAGEIKANIHEVPLSMLFKDLKSEWVPQLEEAKRAYRTFPIHVSILTDPILLLSMLRNILANAIRHTSGDVLVGARRRNNHVRIEIWDQGKGIPNADTENVFTEFFQLNNPERDRTKGLGLGLAIVKRLSLLMNHPIHLKSFEGSGLCFSIDVPIVQSSIDVLSASKIDYNDNVAGCFVLVIDDEEDIRDSLQILLKAWGCEVLVAGSLQTALTEMEQDQYPAPGAIIADYRLREGQVGTDAVASVMKFFGKNIPTLIVTGDTDTLISKICLEQGYTLLHKPLSSNKLHSALQKVLHTDV